MSITPVDRFIYEVLSEFRELQRHVKELEERVRKLEAEADDHVLP